MHTIATGPYYRGCGDVQHISLLRKTHLFFFHSAHLNPAVFTETSCQHAYQPQQQKLRRRKRVRVRYYLFLSSKKNVTYFLVTRKGDNTFHFQVSPTCMPKALMVFHTLMQETSAAVQLPRFSTMYHYKSIKILWTLEEGAATKLI